MELSSKSIATAMMRANKTALPICSMHDGYRRVEAENFCFSDR
jgi:hypothetical protein